ncbi:HAD family hydrolase [Cytobacillus suaedae]|nr:HAD family hydrolase [Cytobacillus suaedae]
MATYKVLLFDLDGTLSDPAEGITKSVQYALEKLGIVESNLENLQTFIGPPLQVSFSERYGFDEVTIKKAIEFYRERFKERGMYENKLYPNVPNLLKSLREQDFTLVVATSKPTIFAKQILEYFKIEHYFDLVVGSNLDGTRSAKADIIQYILNHYNEYCLDDFVMIGDREHDLIGANQTGIDSIGVTYGYGSLNELRQAQATYIVDSVSEIKDVLEKSVMSEE